MSRASSERLMYVQCTSSAYGGVYKVNVHVNYRFHFKVYQNVIELF